MSIRQAAHRAPNYYPPLPIDAAYGHCLGLLAAHGPARSETLAQIAHRRNLPHDWIAFAVPWTTQSVAGTLRQMRLHGYPVDYADGLWSLGEPHDREMAVAMFRCLAAAHAEDPGARR